MPRRGSIQVCLDGKTLRGTIPTGSARGCGDRRRHAGQRKLSAQIVNAHGDSLRTAKGNQPKLREKIAILFAPQQSRPGWSAPPTDFRQATTINKEHGRLEKRTTITVSRRLSGYSTFPFVARVFQVKSWVQLTGGRSRHEIR